jgi:hypothetical protein
MVVVPGVEWMVADPDATLPPVGLALKNPVIPMRSRVITGSLNICISVYFRCLPQA